MRRPIAFVGLALLCGVVLSATVFRDDIARATGLAQMVTVSNTAAQAVPVREQNLDGSANIKVHEQGTANVHVTNSIAVTAQAPIVDGGASTGCPGSGTVVNVCDVNGSDTFTASALSIHMTDGVALIQLGTGHATVGLTQIAASFLGPAEGGNGSIVLALFRPISFRSIACSGGITDFCSVSWVGNSP